MPLDAGYFDDLADIDKTKPLSTRDIKRIVRWGRATGQLSMDHPEPRMSMYLSPFLPFVSPHRVLDDFLGHDRGHSCPCRVGDNELMDKLNKMHFAVFAYRACATDQRHSLDLAAQFDELLAD